MKADKPLELRLRRRPLGRRSRQGDRREALPALVGAVAQSTNEVSVRQHRSLPRRTCERSNLPRIDQPRHESPNDCFIENEPTRRDFLRTAAATAAAAAVFQPKFTIADEGAKGANERIGVGFIGTGGRCAGATSDIVLKLKAAGPLRAGGRLRHLRPARARPPRRKTGGKIYRNYKELLADPRVDVVCIATPDRHHAPQAIDAIRAGKDVYCEKPLTHWSQMDLARQLGEEAEKHKRIVQVGTQYVADDAYAKVRKLIEEGMVGKIVHVQAGYFRRGDWGERMPIPDPNAKPGPDLDWEQFLGDAPKVRFQRLAVLPVAALLGLRRRAGHRSAGPRLHARLLPAGPRFPRAGDGRRRHVPVQPRSARPVQHHRRLRRRAQRRADELAEQLHAASTRSSAAPTA